MSGYGLSVPISALDRHHWQNGSDLLRLGSGRHRRLGYKSLQITAEVGSWRSECHPSMAGRGSARRCCVAPTCRALERDFDLCSDRQGQLVERHGQPSGHRLLGGQLVVSAAKVLTKACPAMITLALWSCLSPRIGRNRAFNRPCRPRLGCWPTARFGATPLGATPGAPSDRSLPGQ